MSDTGARRRPATRSGRPVLTREIIARGALEIAGRDGFPAVTMRSLATHLGVSPRALYNYVDDRRDVVAMAVQMFMSEWSPVDLDVDRWEDGVRAHCEAIRAVYRRYPRAITVALDEDLSGLPVPVERLRRPEEFLAFLVELGLTVEEAVRVHGHFFLTLFGFALLVEHRERYGPARSRPSASTSFPPQWHADHPDLELPVTAAAARLEPESVDAQFGYVVEVLLGQVRALLRG